MESDNRMGLKEALAALQEVQSELQRIREEARVFGNLVLEGDTYGCEYGPGNCLHMKAKKFLDTLKGDT